MIREKKDGCKSYNEIYAKEKKMRVKQMVEVKNTYEIMSVEQTVDLIKKKKRGVKNEYYKWSITTLVIGQTLDLIREKKYV